MGVGPGSPPWPLGYGVFINSPQGLFLSLSLSPAGLSTTSAEQIKKIKPDAVWTQLRVAEHNTNTSPTVSREIGRKMNKRSDMDPDADLAVKGPAAKIHWS